LTSIGDSYVSALSPAATNLLRAIAATPHGAEFYRERGGNLSLLYTDLRVKPDTLRLLIGEGLVEGDGFYDPVTVTAAGWAWIKEQTGEEPPLQTVRPTADAPGVPTGTYTREQVQQALATARDRAAGLTQDTHVLDILISTVQSLLDAQETATQVDEQR
jgi:hypothetical protein